MEDGMGERMDGGMTWAEILRQGNISTNSMHTQKTRHEANNGCCDMKYSWYASLSTPAPDNHVTTHHVRCLQKSLTFTRRVISVTCV